MFAVERHYDAGSLVTMDLMLSSTADFTGGVFTTLEADGELLPHTFERGDLLIFLSVRVCAALARDAQSRIARTEPVRSGSSLCVPL